MHAFLYSTINRSIGDKNIPPLLKLNNSEPPTSCCRGGAFYAIADEIGNASAEKPTGELGDWTRPYEAFRRESNITSGMRRLFWTDNGVLGVSPLEIEIGLEVWIVTGVNIPVVLRNGSAGRSSFLESPMCTG